MLQSSATEKRSVHLRVLSDDQVWEIQRAALEVLWRTGCDVLHDGALRLLQSTGAVVRGQRVKLPPHLVEGCIRTAPKGFTIYNRLGAPALEVEGRKSYYGSSTASPRTLDPFTGEVRPTTVADIAFGAKVADTLSNIDWVMPFGSSQDVHPLAADAHEFAAVVSNTTKPMVFIAYSPQGAERVYDMAATIAGGSDALRERPFLLIYPECISPLVYPAEVVDRIFVAADRMMPIVTGPAVQLGATGPVTLAGTIAQSLAEALMGLVLSQLRKPGTPVVLGVNIAAFDMSAGVMSMASPEMSLGLAAQTEVAHAWGLPTWGTAGATDAKTVDAQAGAESAFSILAQGLAGLNLIHDVGYTDMGMECSPEMLVLGDEIIGMAKRFIRGIEVNAETLARDVIDRVGPAGHYLSDAHTLRHFRGELWRPGLMTRQEYSEWRDAGAKDAGRRIRERLATIRDAPPSVDLPGAAKACLEEAKRRADEDSAAK